MHNASKIAITAKWYPMIDHANDVSTPYTHVIYVPDAFLVLLLAKKRNKLAFPDHTCLLPFVSAPIYTEKNVNRATSLA